ncbi:MAG: T9SS type A sorting domain-containing protein [Chitinophagaceae bacterium]|nr:T9SS type A sorting domain-containing protein [Chitinophagaceae bacterium]
MKKLLLSMLCAVGMISSFSQIPPVDTASCIHFAHIDSLYTLCNTNPQPNFTLNIEPTANQIWQVGNTTKFGTAHARDTSCAIFTDTTNTYPTANYSAFNFLLPTTPGQGWGWNNNHINYYLKFWHKFETDSLFDGCWIEVSLDSGSSWYALDSIQGSGFGNNFWNGSTACNLYNAHSPSFLFDTLYNGRHAWSGSSHGWIYTALHLNRSFPLKPERGSFINAVRFVFESDSVQTNKPGWIIDDFAMGYVESSGGLNESVQANQLPVYPNPSISGKFSISYPSKSVEGSIEIFNLEGKKIMSKSLQADIDLSKFPNGLYYYRALFDKQTYSGVLNKN